MSEEPPQPVTGIEEGEVLFGKYRVDRVLGVGGMGAVVAAQHLQLDTTVAIKFLLPSSLESAEAVERFAREARAAVQMNNEHVARVYDVGTLPSGAPYMVMEFLDGSDLSALLQQRGPLPVKEAVDYVLQACEAVAEAHTLGIVHRDLKPANLFCIVRPDGRRMIKVLDFGISKMTGTASWPPPESLTRIASLMGTPLYMSPEQLEAPQTVDLRTDIWSLGIVLYELLSGKMPFNGNTLPQVSVKIAVRAPPPLHEFRPDVPDDLVAVIERCLEKEREKRYQQVAELALALLPFGTRRARVWVERIAEMSESAGLCTIELPAPQSLSPTSRSLMSDTTPVPADEARRPRDRRSGRPTALAAGLAGAAVIALLWLGERWVSRSSEGAAPGAGRDAVAASSLLARADDSDPAPAGSGVVPAPIGSLVATRAVAGDANADGVRAAERVRVPSGKPMAAAKTLGKSSCDPNFDVDEQGRKHFRPECLIDRPAPAPTVQAHLQCNPSYDVDEQGRKHFKPECFPGAAR